MGANLSRCLPAGRDKRAVGGWVSRRRRPAATTRPEPRTDPMRERPVIPSVDEIEQLPRLLELTVPPEYEDYNGHMKITHHLGLHDDGGPAFFALLGLDET